MLSVSLTFALLSPTSIAGSAEATYSARCDRLTATPIEGTTGGLISAPFEIEVEDIITTSSDD